MHPILTKLMELLALPENIKVEHEVLESGNEIVVFKNVRIILSKTSVLSIYARTPVGRAFDIYEKQVTLDSDLIDAYMVLEGYIPAPDMAVEHGSCIEDSLNYACDTKSPVKLNYGDEALVIITDRAYQYMLSKLTRDELYDVGFLGESEKHVAKADEPELFKRFRKK